MVERNYWMIGADGNSYGPADLATILRWISEQRIASATQISTAAGGPWLEAQSYPELADALVAQSLREAGAHGGAAQAAPAHDAAAPASPPQEPGTPAAAVLPAGWPPSSLQYPLLIGGIFNIIHSALGALVAVFMAAPTFCCSCLLGLPTFAILVMGIIQCIDYTRAATMDRDQYFGRIQLWAVLNTVLILFGSLPAGICGIVMLCTMGEARRQAYR